MAKPLWAQIKEKFELVGNAYHLTHIDNLEEIIALKGILPYSAIQGHPYTDLSNSSVQLGRSAVTVPVNKKQLHDYVPLYFGWKTPMVMVHQDKNEKLIFLRFSLDLLSTPEAIFSDGNARSNATKFYAFSKLEDLSVLDVKTINAVKGWPGNEEMKRKKQAELLIPDFLPISQLLDIICFSKSAENRVLDIFLRSCINPPKVIVNPGWYYRPKE